MPIQGRWWQTVHRTCKSPAAQVHGRGLHGAAAEMDSLPCMLVPVSYEVATSLSVVMLGRVAAVKPLGRKPVDRQAKGHAQAAQIIVGGQRLP